MQPDEDSALEYDSWHWHTEGVFPKDQAPEQGYVHIGVYLAWLVQHQMVDPDWVARSGLTEAVAAVHDRAESPCWLRDRTDGRLAADMLTVEGRGFTGAYYAPEYGYTRDWGRAFGRQADNYAVPDGWKTYDWIAPVIDGRYRAWVEAGRPELMPMPRLLAALLRLARSRGR